jgi:AraC-like DNA-binding protein
MTCFEKRKPGDKVAGMLLREGVDSYTLQKMRLKLEILLTELISSLSKEGSSISPKSQRWEREYADAITFMRQNLHRSLTLSEIANGCSMSVSKLKLLFREKHGGGPITCFIELKIDEAKRLIRGGKMNFSEISSSLGFNSLHYFSRLFKSMTGRSPSEYAKGNGRAE